jgi:hypothetical protein
MQGPNADGLRATPVGTVRLRRRAAMRDAHSEKSTSDVCESRWDGR